jgi:hypothetical protein
VGASVRESRRNRVRDVTFSASHRHYISGDRGLAAVALIWEVMVETTGTEGFNAVDELDEMILAARASVVAKLDAVTDFDGLLAGIYAAADTDSATGPDRATGC